MSRMTNKTGYGEGKNYLANGDRDPIAPHNQPSRRIGRQRKDTRRWCKGVAGREHEIEIRIWHRFEECRSDLGRLCVHVELCTLCGKVVRRLSDSECPDRERRES